MDKISYSPQVCDEPAAIFQRVEFPRTSRVPRRTERTERPLFIRGASLARISSNSSQNQRVPFTEGSVRPASSNKWEASLVFFLTNQILLFQNSERIFSDHTRAATLTLAHKTANQALFNTLLNVQEILFLAEILVQEYLNIRISFMSLWEPQATPSFLTEFYCFSIQRGIFQSTKDLTLTLTHKTELISFFPTRF